MEVFEQQLLTFCLLKFLGCQSISLCICLVCLSIYLCDYVCLHVFLLFFCLGSVMAVYISLFFMSPVFLCALYGLYVSIFVIISIYVFSVMVSVICLGLYGPMSANPICIILLPC